MGGLDPESLNIVGDFQIDYLALLVTSCAHEDRSECTEKPTHRRTIRKVSKGCEFWPGIGEMESVLWRQVWFFAKGRLRLVCVLLSTVKLSVSCAWNI